jgi:hypothetical protein
MIPEIISQHWKSLSGPRGAERGVFTATLKRGAHIQVEGELSSRRSQSLCRRKAIGLVVPVTGNTGSLIVN